MPGTNTAAGEIVYSNGFATIALAEREGCEIVDLGIAPDRLPETVAAIRRAGAAGADILVTSGALRLGTMTWCSRRSRVKGWRCHFGENRHAPGPAMLHGSLGAMHVLGLPANPVSAYVCAFLFLVPLIRRLTGRADTDRVPESAVLGGDLPETTSARTICAQRSPPARTEARSQPHCQCRTAPCWCRWQRLTAC